jgi:hypothetical protein
MTKSGDDPTTQTDPHTLRAIDDGRTTLVAVGQSKRDICAGEIFRRRA